MVVKARAAGNDSGTDLRVWIHDDADELKGLSDNF